MVTTYGPLREPLHGQFSGGRVYSGVDIRYGTNSSRYVTNTSTASNYRTREISIFDSSVKTGTAATNKANKFLAAATTEEEVILVELEMTAAQVNEIRAGMLIEVKFPHLGIPEFDWRRVVRREVRPRGEGEKPSYKDYHVALELSNPRTTRWVNRGSGGPPEDTPVGGGDAGCMTFAPDAWTPFQLNVGVDGLIDTIVASGNSVQVGPDSRPNFVGTHDPDSIYAQWSGGAYADLDPVLPFVNGIGEFSGQITLPAVPAHLAYYMTVWPMSVTADWFAVGFQPSDEPDNLVYLLPGPTVQVIPDAVPGDTLQFTLRYDLNTLTLYGKVWTTTEPTAWTTLQTGIADYVAGIDRMRMAWHINNDDSHHFDQDPAYPMAFAEEWAATIWDLGWCFGDVPTTPAYYGQPFGPVFVGTGDDTTTDFTLPYPVVYTPGTLHVYVAGLLTLVTEDDPTLGTFHFAAAPAMDAEILASWRVASA